MNNFKEKIKERFNHIDFNTIDFDQWFYQSYLPTIILKSIGGVEDNPDGSGSYDFDNMHEIVSYLDHLKTNFSSGFSDIDEEIEIRKAKKDLLTAGAFLKSRNYSTMDIVDEVYGLEDLPSENKKQLS